MRWKMFDESGLPIQKKYAVAYVDVLGVSQKIMAESEWGLFNLWILVGPLLRDWKAHERIKIKVFSDNILICEEIDESNPKIAIADVFSVVDTIESSLFNMGALFIRGAIVVDNLHFSDEFVYGKALLKAYSIEDKIATYPRIIIDSSVLEIIDKKENYIALDKDGLYFYDFMQARIDKGGVRLRQELGTFKANILINILNNASEPSIVSKMEWLVNYYNNRCLNNNLKNRISSNDICKIGLKVDSIHIISKYNDKNKKQG